MFRILSSFQWHIKKFCSYSLSPQNGGRRVKIFTAKSLNVKILFFMVATPSTNKKKVFLL